MTLYEIKQSMVQYKMEGRFHTYTADSPFSIEDHKENFTCYLEVIINSEGVVSYAIPSHQQVLFNLAKLTMADVPADRSFDVLDFLLERTKAVAVWTDYIRGTPNEVQRKVLTSFKRAGIYLGSL